MNNVTFDKLADKAEVFGIIPITARAYFSMSQLDYNAKITIKEARELFKRF